MHLSHKYIADRFLPDKAIDLLDEAGSRVRITAYNARRSSSRTESPKVRPAHSLGDGRLACLIGTQHVCASSWPVCDAMCCARL